MAVFCPVCQAYSTDYDLCEHCQADLRELTTTRPPAECSFAGGVLALTEEQRQRLSDPEQAILVTNSEKWLRIHWLDRRADREWHTAWELRRGLAVDFLPAPEAIDSDEGTWIVVPTMGRSSASWSTSHQATPLEQLQRVVAFAGELAETLEGLHRRSMLWLNFDPSELERDVRGRLTIANLDVRVFPFGQAPHALAIHPAYAAPEVVHLRAGELGPRTDVFHLSALCYYWLARFLPSGLPGQGLEVIDFVLPPLRTYAPHVPEGVAAILARGMAPELAQRYATPTLLVGELKDALERAQIRRAYCGQLSWEIGSQSIAGRTKAHLKRGNEDQAYVHRYANPERALVAVADGITTCDVGNGALASFIATIVLENSFDAASTAAEFPERIRAACLKCSRTLLDWAIEKGHRDRLLQGQDLMGSTLTVGWLQGNLLQIANLGDSRVYLIEGGRIEQLTVDGDLASDMLAQATPPEKVREIGSMGKALRQCIGGCETNDKGELVILDDASTPTLSRWALMPGDVLVFCSDGLVEEGAFLEPEILVEIMRNNPRATARELAELFTEAADALQRLPSILEPDGFGDNVTCVVVKIGAAG
jgi:serine/threonine protein phosphatase PrpC